MHVHGMLTTNLIMVFRLGMIISVVHGEFDKKNKYYSQKPCMSD